MPDTLSKERRSWNMSRIRSADTKPEILLRSLLHRMGFRFRLHQQGLPGRPDIVLPKHRTAIFVHGCFWHQHPGCVEAVRPKTNLKYWTAKLDANVARDKRNRQALRKQGWRVFRFWECQIEKDPIRIAMWIAKQLPCTEQASANFAFPPRSALLRAAEARVGYTTRKR